MSSLFSSLQTASTALDVYSRALGNEEANVANSSTAGYAALRTSIHAIGQYGPPAGTQDYIEVTSSGDSQSDALYRAAASQASASQTQTSVLDPVNQIFDITGSTGLLSAFQNFSTDFANLSVNPNSQTLQSTAIAAAGSVAAEFHNAAVQVDAQRDNADTQIASVVSQINGLAQKIRDYNVQVRSGVSPQSGASSNLRSALDDISSLVDASVQTNADGTVSVLAGAQQPIVLADQVFTLSYTAANAPGQQITSSAGGLGPAEYSGKLGALLDFRNNTVGSLTGNTGAQGALNQLAEGFGSRVNALLAAGVTSAGVAGAPIFTWDTVNNRNIAKSIAIDPAFTQTSLATGTATASNGTADALAKLVSSGQAADQINGLSAQDFFAGIAAGVGQQLSAANAQSAGDQTALVSAQSVRQQSSGVSLDQEAVAITAYQRAYQANAKVISIVDELTSDVVALIK